jgi:hypothetical protein
MWMPDPMTVSPRRLDGRPAWILGGALLAVAMFLIAAGLWLTPDQTSTAGHHPAAHAAGAGASGRPAAGPG